MILKLCTKCDTTKTHEEFSRNRVKKDGRAIWCKTCTSAYGKAWNANPEVKKRAAVNALMRYHAMPEEDRKIYNGKGRRKGWQLKAKYGITMDDYLEMLEGQGGVCAICSKPPSPDKLLSVDHDHSCCPSDASCGDCVRGLLCITCNVWLGTLENGAWKRGADSYLENHASRQALHS